MKGSKPVDISDSLGKSLRSFLRQIVPDAAIDDPVLRSAGERFGVGSCLRVWCPIRVTFKCDGGKP